MSSWHWNLRFNPEYKQTQIQTKENKHQNTSFCFTSQILKVAFSHYQVHPKIDFRF